MLNPETIRDWPLPDIFPTFRHHSDLVPGESLQADDICLLQTGAFLSTLDQPSQSLFAQFLQSPGSVEIIKTVARYSSSRQAISYISGRLFEEIGFLKIQEMFQGPNNMVVLSGQETQLFYREVNPTRRIATHYNLTTSIEQISFPDCLLLRETPHAILVEALCECKLGSKLNFRAYQQLNSFLNPQFVSENLRIGNNSNGPVLGSVLAGAILHQIRPDLPSKPLALNPYYQLIYVMPENSELKNPQIRTITLPFSTHQFGEFLDCLLADCQQVH